MNHKQTINRLGLLLVVIIVGYSGVKLLSGSHAATVAACPATLANGVTCYDSARSANSFLDTEGVNVHMSDPSYAGANVSKTVAALQSLGVRWVRTGSVTSAATIANSQVLVAQAGVKLDFVEEYSALNSDPNLATDLQATVKKDFPNSTVGVEGINEPDNGLFYKPKNGAYDYSADWAQRTCAEQTKLYNAFKGDFATKNIPVLAPSITGINIKTRGPVFDAGCSKLASVIDYGNLHPYPGGFPPESNLDQKISDTRTYESIPSKPIAFTETGYNTALKNTGTHNPISEDGEAVYMPRLYLSYFDAGIRMTSPYELVDEGNDQTNQELTFGFFHANWTPKPAATAVGNMNKILADTRGAAVASANQLTYTISSGADPSLRHVLLQKSDGSYYMALWRDSSVWKVQALPTIAGNTLVPPSSTVTLTFPQSMNSTAYKPNSVTGATPWQPQVTALSKQVSVGPDVVILKLTAATGSPVTPAPSSAPSPSPTPGVLLGDLDGDHHVTGHDVALLLINWNKTVPANTAGDLDGNGLVNGHDVALMLTNWGK